MAFACATAVGLNGQQESVHVSCPCNIFLKGRPADCFDVPVLRGMLLQDYRLNWRLNTACDSDIKRLCGGLCDISSGQPCGGVVLQCLQVRANQTTVVSQTWGWLRAVLGCIWRGALRSSLCAVVQEHCRGAERCGYAAELV